MSPQRARLLKARARARGASRGAIMIIGVFMAMFLIGAMWTVVGLGDALVYRDRTQELADHIAFSSATVQARGMNFIAAINVIMLCVVAVYMVIDIIDRVLQGIEIAAAIPCASYFLSAIGCPVESWAATSENTWHQWRNTYYNGMKPWLIGMSWTQYTTAVVSPYAGTAASLLVADDYKESGFAISLSMIPMDALTGGMGNGSYDWSAVSSGNHNSTGSGNGGAFSSSQLDTRIGLPVKNEAMRQLCVYGSDQVLEWVEGWVESIPVIGLIMKIPGLKGLINRVITAALTTMSCSDSFWDRDGPKAPYQGQSADNGASDWHQTFGLVFGKQKDVSTNKVALGLGPKLLGMGRANITGERLYQAQAEIYYDCAAEWETSDCNRAASDTYAIPHAMYNMRWMVRLRRVHWPSVEGIFTQLLTTAVLQKALGPLQGKITGSSGYQGAQNAVGGLLGGGGSIGNKIFGDMSDQALHSLYGKISSIFPGGINPPTSSVIH